MRDGEFSPVELSERVLGTPFFYDETRSDIANTNPEELQPEDIGERRLIYTSLLRQLATLRSAERTSSDDAFDGRYWEPAPHEYQELRAQFEPHAKRLKLINNLENYVYRYKSGHADTGLRPHQQDAFDNLLAFMRSGTTEAVEDTSGLTKSGFMDLPTAYGKTFIMTELVKAFSDRSSSGEIIKPPRTLVLIPRKLLGKQTIGEDAQKGFGKFAPEIRARAYFGGRKELEGDVVVMTYQSFNRCYQNGTLADQDFDILICDEVHHGLGRVVKKNIDEFRRDKLAIGLTASSEYSNKKKVDYLFPQLIHRTDLRTAIEANILAGVQCWSYRTGASLVVNSVGRSDFNELELAPLIENETRNQQAVKFTRAFIEKGLQGIAACIPGGNCAHAIRLAELMNNTEVTDPISGKTRLIRAAAVGSFLSDLERDEILEQFREGQLDVLTYVKMIGEGWDSEEAKFLINLCPTVSPVRSIQRLGRVLRPNQDGQIAQVVEFLDDISEGQKHQYTFMHALGEDVFYQGKLLESEFADNDHPGAGEKLMDLREFPEELARELAQYNAIPMDELVVMPKPQEKPPEDWLPMAALSQIAGGMNPQHIRKMLIENGFEGRIARGQINTPTYYFSPEAAEYLRNNIVLDVAPEGWLTSPQMQKELNATQSMVERVARDLNMTGTLCRNSRNSLAAHFSPAEYAQIKAVIDSYQVAAPGEHSLKSLSEELGISETTVRKFFAKKQIEGIAKRTTEKGPFAFFYSESEAALARESLRLPPMAEEGWMSIGGIARALQTDSVRVERYISTAFPDEQGAIYRSKTKGGTAGRPTTYFAPFVVQQALAALAHKSVPDGWREIKDIEKQYGISRQAIRKTLEMHGIPVYRQAIAKKRGVATLIDKDGQAVIENAYGNLEPASEGWMTIGEAAREAGVADSVLRNYLSGQKDIETRRMRARSGTGLPSNHYPAEIFKEAIEKYKSQQAPEGWVALTELAKQFGVARETVKGILSKYDVDTMRFQNSRGASLYCAPGAKDVINDVLGNVGLAPSGWMNISQIAEVTGRASATVQNFISSNETFSASAQRLRGGARGQITYYYPPEIAEAARAELEKVQLDTKIKQALGRDDLDTAWEAVPRLVEELNLSSSTINRLLAATGIESVVVQLSPGRSTLAYPAQAAREHLAAYNSLSSAPEGWLTVNAIASKLHVSHGVVTQYLAGLKNPLPTTKMVNSRGMIHDHYAPDVVDSIAAALQPDDIPENWQPLTKVSELYNVNYSIILRMLRSKGIEPPMLRQADGYTRMYLTPEDVKTVEAFAAIPEASEGWLTMSEIAAKVGVKSATIRYHLAKIDIDDTEERVMKSRNIKNRPFVHYAPDAIKRLLDHLGVTDR